MKVNNPLRIAIFLSSVTTLFLIVLILIYREFKITSYNWSAGLLVICFFIFCQVSCGQNIFNFHKPANVRVCWRYHFLFRDELAIEKFQVIKISIKIQAWARCATPCAAHLPQACIFFSDCSTLKKPQGFDFDYDVEKIDEGPGVVVWRFLPVRLTLGKLTEKLIKNPVWWCGG